MNEMNNEKEQWQTDIENLIHVAFSPDECTDSRKENELFTQSEKPQQLTNDIDYNLYMGKRYESLCKEYQRKIKLSEQCTTAIIQGLKSGEALETLFIGSAKAISLMTNDDVFFRTVCREIEKRLS